MKKNYLHIIGVGLFIMIGIILFTLSIFFIGQNKNLFSNTFRISSIFKNVNGLQVGNNVRFSGINVGTVEDIEIISDSSVRVDLIIEEDTKKFIKKNSKAIIGSEGLMGNKIILITPGSSDKEIQNNDIIASSTPIAVEDILTQLQATTENATQITNDLSEIMSNIRAGKGTIGKLFMDTTFADNLDQTLVNLKKGTKGFEQNMDAAKNSLLLKGILKKEKDKENPY